MSSLQLSFISCIFLVINSLECFESVEHSTRKNTMSIKKNGLINSISLDSKFFGLENVFGQLSGFQNANYNENQMKNQNAEIYKNVIQPAMAVQRPQRRPHMSGWDDMGYVWNHDLHNMNFEQYPLQQSVPHSPHFLHQIPNLYWAERPIQNQKYPNQVQVPVQGLQFVKEYQFPKSTERSFWQSTNTVQNPIMSVQQFPEQIQSNPTEHGSAWSNPVWQNNPEEVDDDRPNIMVPGVEYPINQVTAVNNLPSQGLLFQDNSRPNNNENILTPNPPPDTDFSNPRGEDEGNNNNEPNAILGRPVIVPSVMAPAEEKILFFNDSTTESPAQIQCVQDCRTTSEYNPICGTNNITYFNPGRFVCARSCGIRVFIQGRGRCDRDKRKGLREKALNSM